MKLSTSDLFHHNIILSLKKCWQTDIESAFSTAMTMQWCMYVLYVQINYHFLTTLNLDSACFGSKLSSRTIDIDLPPLQVFLGAYCNVIYRCNRFLLLQYGLYCLDQMSWCQSVLGPNSQTLSYDLSQDMTKYHVRIKAVSYTHLTLPTILRV